MLQRELTVLQYREKICPKQELSLNWYSNCSCFEKILCNTTEFENNKDKYDYMYCWTQPLIKSICNKMFIFSPLTWQKCHRTLVLFYYNPLSYINLVASFYYTINKDKIWHIVRQFQENRNDTYNSQTHQYLALVSEICGICCECFGKKIDRVKAGSCCIWQSQFDETFYAASYRAGSPNHGHFGAPCGQFTEATGSFWQWLDRALGWPLTR